MASKNSDNDTAETASPFVTGVADKPEQEAVEEKRLFSEPWEDSDLVLVVEDEKFHVHRQILSIHSPVFKAMLNTQFKEATANEIPLPGKKPNEILDFLKQLYLKETEGIALTKVEHLLKLADEYQAKAVLDLCVKCLKDEPKSEENVVKILFLANSTVMAKEDDRLDSVRKKCYDLIRNMELNDIVKTNVFKNLDRDTSENVFMHRTERLEIFLSEIYPQFAGLVEYALWACMEQSRSKITPCPQHFVDKKAKEDLFERIQSCPVCKRMVLQLVSSSTSKSKFGSTQEYGGSYRFDEDLVSIIQDFHKVLRPEC